MDPLVAVSQLLAFPDELDKLLNPSAQTPAQNYVRDSKAMAGTAVDVKEHSDSYVFVADMPGSADVKVRLENDNVLIIGGERKVEEQAPGVRYIRMERSAGKFMRKFTLPGNANLDGISASYKDGVLIVTVPKIPPPEPRKPKIIDVTVG